MVSYYDCLRGGHLAKHSSRFGRGTVRRSGVRRRPRGTAILYAMTVMNGTTGQFEHEFTSPPLSGSGWGYGSTLTISEDGEHAVVLSNLYPSQAPQSIRVDHINLSTGTISGPVTTTNAIGGGLSVDPKSGLI